MDTNGEDVRYEWVGSWPVTGLGADGLECGFCLEGFDPGEIATLVKASYRTGAIVREAFHQECWGIVETGTE